MSLFRILAPDTIGLVLKIISQSKQYYNDYIIQKKFRIPSLQDQWNRRRIQKIRESLLILQLCSNIQLFYYVYDIHMLHWNNLIITYWTKRKIKHWTWHIDPVHLALNNRWIFWEKIGCVAVNYICVSFWKY